MDIKKKGVITFKSNSVILAAGGYSHVYTPSSSRIFENYGEGVALAYDVGADLIDMEIVIALNTIDMSHYHQRAIFSLNTSFFKFIISVNYIFFLIHQ
jgi:aspartate oxidase